MLLTLACLLAAAAAAPVLYDQRQDGELNVSADVQNVVFVIAYPQKMSLPLDFLDDFMKNNKQQNRESGLQDRADHVMDAFVEPNEPYRVEIGSDRSAGGDGRAVEVVISGRRRLETEAEPQSESEEIKLIGSREQCGPERERDPVTLKCRLRVQLAPQPTPEDNESPQITPEVVPSVTQ